MNHNHQDNHRREQNGMKRFTPQHTPGITPGRSPGMTPNGFPTAIDQQQMMSAPPVPAVAGAQYGATAGLRPITNSVNSNITSGSSAEPNLRGNPSLNGHYMDISNTSTAVSTAGAPPQMMPRAHSYNCYPNTHQQQVAPPNQQQQQPYMANVQQTAIQYAAHGQVPPAHYAQTQPVFNGAHSYNVSPRVGQQQAAYLNPQYRCADRLRESAQPGMMMARVSGMIMFHGNLLYFLPTLIVWDRTCMMLSGANNLCFVFFSPYRPRSATLFCLCFHLNHPFS